MRLAAGRMGNEKKRRLLDLIDMKAIGRDVLDFVSIPSETGQETDAVRFFADLLAREGLSPSWDEAAPERHNLYARVRGTTPEAGRSLMLHGHMDTIPISGRWPPVRDGDWVIGRGAEDMKGGLVAMAHAASALQKAGVGLAGDLWLTAIVGHEEGKEGTLRLVDRLRAGAMSPDAILICEGPSSLWVASLGATVFHITLTSALGPIHTSLVPYAENPARWLGEMLMAFLDKERAFARQPAHPLCGRELINIGVAKGGDYYNRVPTPITVSGQWRWTPGKTFAEVDCELRALCQDICERGKLHYRTEYDGEREPFETPASDPFVATLAQTVSRITGSEPEVIGRAVTGDANYYAQVPLWRGSGTIPTAYYGPGGQETTSHSDHERVSVQAVYRCAQIYALTAMAYCAEIEPESDQETLP